MVSRKITTGFLACVLLIFAVFSSAGAAGSTASLGVEPGNLAPEFTFQNEAGEWVSLSDFRGKKVFLFSWATWCRCKEQLPALEEFYQKHKSDTFEVIAVASDSQGFKWVKKYLDDAGATFVALVDPANELARTYNFLATENGFLIDENGVMRMNAIGFDIRKDEQRSVLLEMMAADFEAVETSREPGTPEEQIEAAVEKLKADPKNLQNWYDLSELYRVAGKLDDAEGVLNKLLGKKKKDSEAHYRLGVVLYQKGSIEDAVSEWEKAFKYEPTNYLYMRNIEAYRDPEKFYSELMED